MQSYATTVYLEQKQRLYMLYVRSRILLQTDVRLMSYFGLCSVTVLILQVTTLPLTLALTPDSA